MDNRTIRAKAKKLGFTIRIETVLSLAASGAAATNVVGGSDARVQSMERRERE